MIADFVTNNISRFLGKYFYHFLEMYQFWCFLCAGKEKVDVEIQSLNEATRESIGIFSLIVILKKLYKKYVIKILNIFLFLEFHTTRSSFKNMQILSRILERTRKT